MESIKKNISIINFVFVAIMLHSACLKTKDNSHNLKNIDIQGHRGCRGTMPENSIEGFIEAINNGVTTIEMDVVISKDYKVVASHEHFFSHEISRDHLGNDITAENEKTWNLYQMNYSDIKLFDCGSKIHPRFPTQKKLFTYKPLLEDVIDTVEEYVLENNLSPVKYNIEIKSSIENEGLYHPSVDVFCKLVVDIISKKNITNRVTIQSFDERVLNHLFEIKSPVSLAFLVENNRNIHQSLSKLNFTPTIYSPYYKLLNEKDVKELHQKNILVIPWTVNDSIDIQEMLNIGVDGIISDFPMRVYQIINDQKQFYLSNNNH